MLKDIKTSNEKQWYSKLKRITRHDQHLVDPIEVNSICKYSYELQAEMIEDKFPQISQEYDALNSHDISIPPFTEKSFPHITQSEVKMTLSKIKIKVSRSQDIFLHAL